MANITLLNFDINNTITVNYPLLYLHGTIKCAESESSFISCVNKTSNSSNIWPVNETEFKVFVLLAEAKNEIVLTGPCGKETLIHADYTKRANGRYVLPIYIICKNSDGCFMAPVNVPNTTEDAITKIQLNTRLIQTFFAESLYEHGFERKTFDYAEDLEKRPLVKIVNSEIELDKIKELSRDELYESFYQELKKLLPPDPCRKLLVFMSCTRYNAPEDEKEFKIKDIQSYATGHAALGGGDMALFGTGSLHTWASDLSELNFKFSDNTIIDRTCLFDDSCGRGTYMDNYSTTLGATVHELGHTFDLAHTPQGIMCRGHDDMNFFYTVVKPIGPSDSSNDYSMKYKGAHWYRSSAVILNHNKWFNSSKSPTTSGISIKKSLHPRILGPVGNVGPWCQTNQISFNSESWMDENNVELIGFIFYHNKYLNGLQFVGIKQIIDNGVVECIEKVLSDVYGQTDEAVDTKTEFLLNEQDERITEIKVRSGAYIDGIEVTTNKKCTGCLGGDGGDLTTYKIGSDQSLQGCIGTAGQYVGSVGFLLRSSPEMDICNDVSFSSPNGIRLIETYLDNGEVESFEEYLDNQPPEKINRHMFECGDVKRNVNGMVYDDDGEKLCFSINELEQQMISQLS